MDQLKTQVDATLTVMADAVSTLKAQFDKLASGGGALSQPELDAHIARLKSGTDTLAAAIASAKAALQ